MLRIIGSGRAISDYGGVPVVGLDRLKSRNSQSTCTRVAGEYPSESAGMHIEISMLPTLAALCAQQM